MKMYIRSSKTTEDYLRENQAQLRLIQDDLKFILSPECDSFDDLAEHKWASSIRHTLADIIEDLSYSDLNIEEAKGILSDKFQYFIGDVNDAIDRCKKKLKVRK